MIIRVYNMMNDKWNEIVSRNTLKKIKQCQKYPTKKPNKYIYFVNKEITKKDYTLTESERLLIEKVNKIERKKENSMFITHCECCSSHIISDIIKRQFFSCGTCYCCVGDDPNYDDTEFVSRITREGTFKYYNPEYHYTKYDEFFDNI